MAQELGKLEKPEAAQFRPERKVYLVPLLATAPNMPAEFTSLLERYWSAAADQVAKLEEKVGASKHIFSELIDRPGDEGLALLEQLAPGASRLARAKVEAGASFEVLDDGELLAETMDWERCLMVGLASRKAQDYVSNAYREAGNARYRGMAQRLDSAIGEGEAAVVLLSEQHRVAFPDKMSIFFVNPPELNEVRRWLRDFREKGPAATAEEQAPSRQSNEEEAPPAPEEEQSAQPE